MTLTIVQTDPAIALAGERICIENVVALDLGKKYLRVWIKDQICGSPSYDWIESNKLISLEVT